MEYRKALKIFVSVIFALAFFVFPMSVAATGATPTPTQTQSPTVSPIVSETPSISVTPTVTITTTPEVSQTPTPTPLPSQNTPIAINTVLQVETQFPWNKQIPVKIQLTPRLDGSKMEISWPARSGFLISPQRRVWNNVKKDQTYIAEFTFDPIAIGPQRVSASVTLTTFERNHITTIPVEVTLDAAKIVQPVPEQYRTYETTMYVVIGVVLFIIIPLIIFIVIFYIKNRLVPKWIQARLNEPI
ncbi:MAG: hypothetical protein QY314_04305 [Candidatus Dojkabacteria bacterium]|nr:MAG: hypothetical protein QY314_04305 [Candidatus Dojkabacteria bacterium]